MKSLHRRLASASLLALEVGLLVHAYWLRHEQPDRLAATAAMFWLVLCAYRYFLVKTQARWNETMDSYAETVDIAKDTKRLLDESQARELEYEQMLRQFLPKHITPQKALAYYRESKKDLN